MPMSIEELVDQEEVPPCIRGIIRMLVNTGEADHYARLVLVWYLK